MDAALSLSGPCAPLPSFKRRSDTQLHCFCPQAACNNSRERYCVHIIVIRRQSLILLETAAVKICDIPSYLHSLSAATSPPSSEPRKSPQPGSPLTRQYAAAVSLRRSVPVYSAFVLRSSIKRGRWARAGYQYGTEVSHHDRELGEIGRVSSLIYNADSQWL